MALMYSITSTASTAAYSITGYGYAQQYYEPAPLVSNRWVEVFGGPYVILFFDYGSMARMGKPELKHRIEKLKKFNLPTTIEDEVMKSMIW